MATGSEICKLASVPGSVFPVEDVGQAHLEIVRNGESMRQLTDHKFYGLKSPEVEVCDEPGHGNACHEYLVLYDNSNQRISFQNGPIKESGVNGTTNEALLAIVIDRLRSFQKGEFSCRENALALTKLEESLMWLQKRTRDRLARGVEGTNEK